MRYLLPFRDVQEFLDQLGRIHQSQPDAVVVFADDGEKFGTWPETKKHVYENGWIYRFLDALRDNRHWIETCTLSQVTRDSQPIGHVYLPDSSYREMTEWALPADQLSRYERSTHDLEQVAAWHDVKQLVAAGQWRNFKAKYPETREMYARMLEVSQRLDTLVRSERQAFGDERVHQARTHLYRGQCNCPYWHGAFGGLYLPHLRGAVYQELIRADAALDAYEYALNPQPVVVESRDFNVDSFDEIKLANERVALYLAPAVGGHLYEIDVADVAVNLGASLSRRPEAYHDKIRHAPGDAPAHAVESIHDRVVCKTAGLDQQLQYDSYLRKSLIDHFLPSDSSLRSLAEGAGLELGDFVQTTYQANIESDPVRGAVELTRTGCVAGKSLRLRKRLSVEAADDTLHIHYELADLAIDQPVLFAIEWNMAALATGANDRYVVDARQQRLALLGESLEVHDACWIGLVDEWIGIEVGFGSSRPARFALSPIRSVSQSEAGFELVHQNMCVVLAWEILPQDRWSVDLTFSADTSLARSRRAHQSAGAPSF
jgi:alpha-amylase